MDSVLVVAVEKSIDAIVELLRSQYRDARITAAGSGSKARRLLLETGYDIVIISAPLPDENGVELAVETAAGSEAGVVLLIKAEFAEEIAAKVEDYGVFVVEKPLHKPFFFRALRLVYASGRRLKGLKNEKTRLQDRIEEIRLVDRAKCVLIQYLNLTEPQAHRYIEKQAMDMRLNKKEIALGILKTYEA